MVDVSEKVRLAINGDTEAFSELYSIVYKDMYHIALYNLKNKYDAEDVVSDAVIDAFRSIGILKNERAFRQWIMKILFAKIKRKQKEYINNPHIEFEDYYVDPIDFNYDYHEIKSVLEGLDEESRMLLSMSVLNGFTSTEISLLCDIKPTTIRSKLSRIKQKLRMQLEAE